MFPLASPRPSAPKNRFNCINNRFSILFVVALAAIGTGCSSLDAGGAGSTTAKPAQPIVISAQLPGATVGDAYSAVLAVSGGSAPYNFAVRSGKLPPGLKLSAKSGAISGQPSAAGAFTFMVSVADSARTSEGLKSLSIAVAKPASSGAQVAVAITPASVALVSGKTQQFAAQVINTANHQVTWSSSTGSVSSTGLFTAPNVNSATTVAVVATSKADISKHVLAIVTVTPAPSSTKSPLSLANTNLPEAVEGTPYTAALRASGGTAPYRWKIVSGSLPAGLLLDATEGTINGITSQNGGFGFTIEASDAAGTSVSRKLNLKVTLANTANVDGPAELPHVYIKSSVADTPAPGATHLVKTSASLQSALNSAKCGDTIQLQAGTTFSGAFAFPAKNCDDNHWIVVRTSAPDSALPPEGTRATPCYAGVASLPGRPSFGCAAASRVMAKLEFSSTGSGPVILAAGANHYRLLGLEITREQSKATVYNLVINERNGTSDHVIIDRSWLHGTTQDETTRGVMLTSSTNVAIVDSYFSDFHCNAMGTCTDSQAIGGGIGHNPMGPYKIVNNFLEAAGENILFGGGPAEHTPEDIEVRRNYLFKPLTWMKGQAGFVGGRNGQPFIVKNHFELKNAIRVLFEGNVAENSWGGFSQAGFSILLTPKNQDGACPICVVHDVTIRYNTISHAGNGFQIANVPSATGALSMGMWNVSVHDVVMDDISGVTYRGGGHLFQQSNGNHQAVVHDITINHVTAFIKDPGAMFIVGNWKSFPDMYNFVWSNNILSGTAGFATTGGGADNCAYRMTAPAAMIASCFKNSDFSHNALVGTTAKWPSGNFAPPSASQVKFSNAARSLLGYKLLPSSPFAGAGTDGKDLGADVALVSSAIAGVR